MNIAQETFGKFKVSPVSLDDLTPPENSAGRRALRILHLCDTGHPGNVVQDYISAFPRYSRHEYIEVNPILSQTPQGLDPNDFDLILIHYSLFILAEHYLPNEYVDFIYRFPGPKIQIIQDEYREIPRMKARMRKLGINILISSLSPENIEIVYGGLDDIIAYGAVPGMMTEQLVKQKVLPIKDRRLDVVYRAYTMPFVLGRHGQIKTMLAQNFPAVAEKYGLEADISDRNEDRIYGKDWASFIASSKTGLGCEGGASIFDFCGIQGAIDTYQRLHPNAGFEAVFEKILKPFEGNVTHKAITPRIYEMIALRTAMVLVPGDYRGVIEPWTNYVPLEADFSNVEEVADALKDIPLLQKMADTNYQEIALSPRFTWRHFMGQFDAAVDRALELLEDNPQIERHPHKARPAQEQEEEQHPPHAGVKAPNTRPRILLLCNIQKKRGASANEQINAIRDHSKYHVEVVSMLTNLPSGVDIEGYDIILFHWSVILCNNNWISQQARARLARAKVFKAAFIQDEYRFVDQTKAALRVLGVKLLFTCVPNGEIEKVYPAAELPGLTKVNVLTGYVPPGLPLYPVPDYEDRAIDVSYRGRDVPAWLGELGQEKVIIGQRFKEDAVSSGLKTDIACREGDRIYGDDWFEFLANSKATLGVESGASVFDFRGEIQQKVEAHIARNPEASFAELSKLYFADAEGEVTLNQISPRIFEAAALRTLMVLYEGHYSGVVEPWRHFVPLKKDHSNMDEVVAVIRDPDRAIEITQSTYKEIACSNKYTYDNFVRNVDDILINNYNNEAKQNVLFNQ